MNHYVIKAPNQPVIKQISLEQSVHNNGIVVKIDGVGVIRINPDGIITLFGNVPSDRQMHTGLKYDAYSNPVTNVER